MKVKLKLCLFISAQFVAVIIIILLVLFANKSYTVKFDLNGGTCIDGNLVQTVGKGKAAIAPVVEKEGSYLLEWSESFDYVTGDMTVVAVWDYITSYGVAFEIVSNSNYCLITSCYTDYSGNVYIGSYYNGFRVLGIKESAFKNCSRITGIYLPEGIISIGDQAFYGCTSLQNIVIPSSVEVIGKNILRNCNNLEKITIPFIGSSFGSSSYAYFGYFFGAYSYMYNKTYVPETLKEVIINGRGEIPNKAFYNCINIESINLSNEITKIGDDAFRKCSGIKEIIIPDAVTEIGATAFANCTGLENVTLGKGLITLNDAAFANCTSLKEIVINDAVEYISPNAFQNCINIENFIVDNNNLHYKSENGKLMIEGEDGRTKYIIEEIEYTDDFVDLNDIVLKPGILYEPTFPSIGKDDSIIIDPEKELE